MKYNLPHLTDNTVVLIQYNTRQFKNTTQVDKEPVSIISYFMTGSNIKGPSDNQEATLGDVNWSVDFPK